MTETLYIKNMVCPRCIESVWDVFSELNIQTSAIKLGEVTVTSIINFKLKEKLEARLKLKGFELLEDKNSKLIAQIKSIVINQIHHSEDVLNINFSTYIADQLNQDYSTLSKLFSSVEGVTIERFILKQKVERVKEFIFYKELTLSEIAFKMGYSSVAHLSSQFKKETGMPPSEFKKLNNPNRKSLDSL